MLTRKYRPSLSHFIDSYFASLRRISKFRKPEKTYNLFFRLLKAKPHSEMISDTEGVERPEVSLLLIILLTLFTGTSSISSFHSRSACAPLHVIRQSRSNFPFKQVRGLAYPFFIRVRKVYTSTVRHTHRYAPNFYAIFYTYSGGTKKWGAGFYIIPRTKSFYSL